MTGHNVLHTMGFDAFGLPAEQYAVQTGSIPRITTEANIANYRRQLRRLGLGHDPRRCIATTDVALLPLDAVDLPADLQRLVRPDADRGPPHRRAGRRASSRACATDRPTAATGASSTRSSVAEVVDSYRLAYLDEAPVNWCPGLGTVLANEEVTSDGRSDRGNFPVFKRPLKQWMMRITAYADRLIDDLDVLDWPESIKLMQRNWIGRSEGARDPFPACRRSASPSVSSRRAPTRCSARPTWCSRQSTRWSTC